MKILGLNPPFLPKYSREQRSPAVTKSGTCYYPMWLGYAIGVLEEKEGHTCKLIDSTAHQLGYPEATKLIKEFAPDLILMNVTTGSSVADYKYAAEIKQVLPKVHITGVGTHLSAVPEDAFQAGSGMDSVALREYEFTSVDIVNALQGKTAWKDILGFVWKNEKGEVVRNAPRPDLHELDQLPFVSKVYQRHLHVPDYFYAHSLHPIVTIVSGRGCPHTCVYCVYPQTFGGHKYRQRTVINVVDEMEYIEKHMPEVNEIMFEDDTFTIVPARVREISEEYCKRGLSIPWTCNARAEVNRETLEAMAKANCRMMCVGFESGDQSMLNNMEKRIKLEKIHQFMKDSKETGVMVHGCFLVGNPGETMKTLDTTLQMAKELNPDTAQFFPIMVYPGTKAYDWAKANGYIQAKTFDQWVTADGLHNSVVSTPDLKHEDLVDWCDRARREFYLRPSYVAYKLGQCFTKPREIKRNLMAAGKLAKYLFRSSRKFAHNAPAAAA